MTSKETIGGRRELAGACRAIGLLLAEPDGESAQIVAELAKVNPWLEQAAREVAALPLDRWQAEHTRLFVCGFPHAACPPFESHYRHGHLNGSASLEVEDIYRRAGLEPPEGVPADYLGAMLECAAWLVDSAGEQCGLFAELWVDHIGLWGARFAQDLRENAQIGLYRALGERVQWLIVETGIG
ncbi:TorD/DmsD family molecular chaperone [Rhodoblastus sp.]|uniref:TorD/DmsD family molecular chaperone n=1 Tax=Rhodoblastus sp. TaxID=1962975 RepID=UPI003F9A4A05